MKEKKFLLPAIALVGLLFFGCNDQKPGKNEPEHISKFRIIYNKMRDYEYDEALLLLDTYEKEFPEYQTIGEVTLAMLRLKCYEAMGDLANAQALFPEVVNTIVPGTIMTTYGIGMYELYLERYLFKIHNFEDGVYIKDKLYDFLSNRMNEENNPHEWAKMNALFGQSLLDSTVNHVMFPILQSHVITQEILSNPTFFTDDIEDNKRRTEISLMIEEKELAESTDTRLEYIFKYIASCNENERDYERVFLGLIDYKDIEGNYHSDMVWTMEATKKHFESLAAQGVITKETLESIKKKMYRDELPNDFVALFDEYCK